jgi:hypothetical protein
VATRPHSPSLGSHEENRKLLTPAPRLLELSAQGKLKPRFWRRGLLARAVDAAQRRAKSPAGATRPAIHDHGRAFWRMARQPPSGRSVFHR